MNKKGKKSPKDEALLDKKPKTENHAQLSRPLRLIIFIAFVSLSIVMSGDNGVLSSSKKQIQKDLELTEFQYGFFGSIPSIGRIIGSLLFMRILYYDNRKLISSVCFALNGSLFFVYLITKNKWILMMVRFGIGTVRIYPHIYIPVWVNQFGIQKLKTIMMTIINVTSPLGQTVGYALGTFNKKELWPRNYALVGGLILAISVIIWISPSIYFSAKYNFAGYEEGDSIVQKTDDWKLTSYFLNGEIVKKEKKQGSMLSILKKPAYIFSAFTRANCLFIFQVIHLFITTYVSDALKIDDQKTLFYYYGLASVLGPTVGGSFGGIVSTFFGGYEDKRSTYVVVIFGSLTLASAFPLALARTLIPFCLGIFCFFFFASALLPTVVGYIISSIPLEHKGAGSSLNLLISNLCGNLPGPNVYGYLNGKFKDTNPFFAWEFVSFYFGVGFISILIACYYRYKDLSEKEKQKQVDNSDHIAETKGDNYKLSKKNKKDDEGKEMNDEN